MYSRTADRILDLGAIDATVLDGHFKGVPKRALGKTLAEIGGLRLNVLREEVLFPSALIKQSAIERNSRWMREFLELSGVRICPHGKTTMAPQLFERQLQDGAWGITAATVAHLRVYRAHGVQRILFANQLIGARDIEYVLAELHDDPTFDFYCLVDSHDGLRRLVSIVDSHPIGRTLQVLLEVGAPGGRTGVRTVEEGIALGREISRHGAGIALRGIEAFEGVFGGHDFPQLEGRTLAMLDDVVALARAGVAESWFAPGPVLLSAGGSALFDLVALRLRECDLERETEIILRSGCYLTHDNRHYERFLRRILERTPQARNCGPGLQAALEICAYVQSTPEPGLVIAGLGKRDVSYDIDLPIPLWWFRPGLHGRPQSVPGGCAVAALNDQHAYVRTGADHPLRAGDLIAFGISHPCTTFDKWPILMMVDDDYDVVSAVRTFF